MCSEVNSKNTRYRCYIFDGVDGVNKCQYVVMVDFKRAEDFNLIKFVSNFEYVISTSKLIS